MPSVFTKLNKKTNLKHVRHDYSLSREAADDEIYKLATQENRIIITQDQGFDKQLKIKGTGILILPSHLTNAEMDTILLDFLSNKKPVDFIGKATKVKTDQNN